MYVYRFVDKSNAIIYVGKTKQTLRARFYSHNHLPDERYKKVRYIEYIECMTEADMSMKEALQRAMCQLKPSELKLWLYLSRNINGRVFELSQVDCEDYGLKKDAYHDAVNGLIKKKYLQQSIGNDYDFIEMPT